MTDVIVILANGRAHRGSQFEGGTIATLEACNLDAAKGERQIVPFTREWLVEHQAKLCWRCWDAFRRSADKYD